ncbi:MAG: 4-alpha-glucanotransferase [Parachlamydiales bacterium]|jgi:4-alpha-glucanotransferase
MDQLKKHLLGSLTSRHWETIGIRPHHGICIPLFSLHSQNSSGIGEFTDLPLLIDWCQKVGFDVIQLLPLNECHANDASPYNALSSCALDFVYLGLKELPYVQEDQETAALLKTFDKYKNYPRINYDEIRKDKLDFLTKYTDKFFERFEKTEAFTKFIRQNNWVKEYAAYKILKQIHKLKSWKEWPAEINLDELFHKHKNDLHFYCLIQFLAYLQMAKVKTYASEKGVLLKGDVPLSINPDSVDVYFHRDVFDLNYVIGIPPDDFNLYGDKWGFYLFNWQKLKESNFSWWKTRLSVLSNLYHMYRVDHAVGFFRVWAIPPHEKPSFGQFLPKDQHTWENLGRENLRMLIDSSALLPLAEDLGFIPSFVYGVLRDLGICGTKVLRWEQKPLKEFEPISITTVSTHDTETLRQWWKRTNSEAPRFAASWGLKYDGLLTPEIRKKILKDAHHSRSLFHINLLPEYLAFFDELVHPNPDDERINTPGTVSTLNWSYRLKQPLEQMTAHAGLIDLIREILKTP